jgi:serine/threonine protein kinase
MEMLNKNPKFIGKYTDQQSISETIEKRYLGKLSKKAIELMKSLLELEPKDRPTCEEALAHSYFDGMQSAKHESSKFKIMAKLPFPSQNQSNELGKPKNKIVISNPTPNAETRKSPHKTGKDHKCRIDPSTIIN